MNRFVRRYWFEVMLIIMVFVVRLPSYIEPHWYSDEDIYLTIGQSLNHGLKLYQDVIDNKPPVIFWITSIVHSIVGIKLVLTLAMAVSSVLLWRIAKQIIQPLWVSALAPVTFIMATTLPLFEGNVFNAELLFLPFVTVGVGLPLIGLIRSQAVRGWDYFLAGCFFGIAFLIKVPSLFDIASVIVGLGIWSFSHQRSWSTLVKAYGYILLGWLIPVGLTMARFLKQGLLSNFIYYGFINNFRYMSDWKFIQTSPLIEFLAPWETRIGLYVFGLLMVWIIPKKYVRFPVKFILTWFLSSLFGSLLSLRPYAHYFLQLFPASSLLLTVLLSRLATKTERLMGIIPVIVLIALVCFMPIELYRTQGYYRNFYRYTTHQISQTDYYRWFNGVVPDTYTMGAWLTEHAAKHEKLFVWGNMPTLYTISHLLPAARFVTDYHVIAYDGFADVLHSLTNDPPVYIVDSRYDQSSFPRLYQIINERYHALLRTESGTIYKLNPTSSSATMRPYGSN